VTTAATALAQLSDPHVDVGRGDTAAAKALAAAVRGVLDLRPRPDAVLVSGDLVNTAGARQYERVRELLAPLPMPVYVMAGNHDDRDALREYFALAGGSTGAVGRPFRYSLRVGGLRLIVCDSTIPGHEEGSFDAERREWLARELSADPETPTIVALHHPPLLTGMPAFDEIGLPESDRLALGGLLAESPQVVRVVCGHIHRAIFDTVGGRGVVVCPSTHLQSALEIGTTELRLTTEPPGFAVHASTDAGLASYIQPIRD
jgi:3',5'-cyclic-AMP phosphodiesterase